MPRQKTNTGYRFLSGHVIYIYIYILHAQTKKNKEKSTCSMNWLM